MLNCHYGVAFGLIMAAKKTSLHTYFEQFSDHRVNRNKRHLLSDIIILPVLGVLCGAESWDSIESFGKTKIAFLKSFLKFLHSVPSHDTINRVLVDYVPNL